MLCYLLDVMLFCCACLIIHNIEPSTKTPEEHKHCKSGMADTCSRLFQETFYLSSSALHGKQILMFGFVLLQTKIIEREKGLK